MKFSKIFALIIAAAIAMTALCVSSSAAVTAKLNKTSITLDAGKNYQLYVNCATKSISWSTSNSSVATVNYGMVEAKSEGTATITAKHGTTSLKCTVKVTGGSSLSSYKGTSFDTAVPIKLSKSYDNKYRMTKNQEHVYYKFTTGEAGKYTIKLSHPKDYFGTADAIFKLSDSSKKAITGEEWFRKDISKTYSLKGKSVYYLETWDYVIFSVSKEKGSSSLSTSYKGDSFETAIPIDLYVSYDNKSRMTKNQEHVYYKFTTNSAGTYTITLTHPKDYFGTADAIFKISDSSKNAVSKEEWFKKDITRSYKLNGNSTYYLETWDYVTFTIS